MGLMFQMIEKAGPIPWSTMDLPEGRTIKACSVMFDKEKAKYRAAKAATGENGEEAGPATPATGKGKVRRAKSPPFNLSKAIGRLADPLLAQKRAATEDGTPTASAKKAKTPRKKAVKAEAEVVEEDDEEVKPESED